MKKPFTKQIIVGALALTLIGGGGALAISQNAFAATVTPTAAPAAAQKGGDHGFKELKQVSDQLITFLKLDKATFKSKLATETLAQIATDQGISREALKAELTSEFNAQLDKEKADFAANLDGTVDSKQIGGFGGREDGGPGGKGGKGHNKGARIDLTSTATLLGYTTAADLKTALVSGTSIADLATAKGITVQSVIDLQAAQIVKDLDQQLAAKTITQAQYDKQKVNSTTIATKIVNDKHDRNYKQNKNNNQNDNEVNDDAAVAPTPPITN